MCLFHDWKWEPRKAINGTLVQFATCQKCGKVKVREVLL